MLAEIYYDVVMADVLIIDTISTFAYPENISDEIKHLECILFLRLKLISNNQKYDLWIQRPAIKGSLQIFFNNTTC